MTFQLKRVNIVIMQSLNEIPVLSEAIENANEAQVDCLWAILKYRDLNILRKLKCMAEVFGPNFDLDQALCEVPKTHKGFIIDHATRHLIHDVLLKRSRDFFIKN